MRILFAAKHLHFPQGAGGLERNTHELCLRLLQQGVTPAVVCNLQPDRSMISLTNRLTRKVTPWQRFPVDGQLGYKVYRGWEADDGAAEVVGRFKPDVVIAQSAAPVPLVQSFQPSGLPLMAYFHEALRPSDAAALRQMGDIGLLANSEFTAKKMRDASGFEPAVVIPLVDPEFYKAETNPERVLFVNTVPRKGLEIAFGLAQGRPDVQFDFVLSWILKPHQVEAITARARACGNVTLHPPTNDMRLLYRSARLVLAPSIVEEAWGRVVTEAHVNGIPVLTSDRGGLPEAVGPGGLTVSPESPPSAWGAAFSQLWDDEAEHARFSAAAREFSKRPRIQPDVIVAKFIHEVRTFVRKRLNASFVVQRILLIATTHPAWPLLEAV